VQYVLLYLVLETLTFLLFRTLDRFVFHLAPTPKVVAMNTVKGVLEKVVVVVGLTLHLPHVLTMFGAIKVASSIGARRIDPEYFVVGNFVSILIALLYFIIFGDVLSALFERLEATRLLGL